MRALARVSSSLMEASSTTLEPSRRRSAKLSALAVARSSMAMSSTATRTGVVDPSSCNTESTPAETVRASTPSSPGSPRSLGSLRSSAISRAFRWTEGILDNVSSPTAPNRSDRPAKDSEVSAPLGRAARTVQPFSRALLTATVHSVVLPIPLAPTRTTTGRRSEPSRRALSLASSAWRPTTSSGAPISKVCHGFRSLRNPMAGRH